MMNACPRWSYLAVSLLAAFGCSDPVPPPAQGAVTFAVHPPSPGVNQTTCPVPGMTYQVGTPDLKNCPNNPTGAPTQECPGGSVISGEKGSKISCSVKSAGGSFNFSGSLAAISAAGQAIDIEFNSGVVASDGTPGTVGVSILTPGLQGTGGLSSTNCSVQVINGQVKGGSIWASFECPQVSATEKQYLCGTSGWIVFENCSGS